MPPRDPPETLCRHEPRGSLPRATTGPEEVQRRQHVLAGRSHLEALHGEGRPIRQYLGGRVGVEEAVRRSEHLVLGLEHRQAPGDAVGPLGPPLDPGPSDPASDAGFSRGSPAQPRPQLVAT